jgi:hypothetical protein
MKYVAIALAMNRTVKRRCAVLRVRRTHRRHRWVQVSTVRRITPKST